MQRKSSIHIEAGNLGYLFHNDRSKPTANSIFSQEKNEYFNDAKTALEIYRQELQKRSGAYTKRTGKKLHKNTITHLSAIVNLEQYHTLQDVKKIAEYLEQELDTKVFQIAVHRDEGYLDEETGEKHINYHAHLELMGLDTEGKSIRRKLDRKFLINLQSKVAEILQMERGINYTAERKKRPKRLDTYEYKEHARRKAEKVKLLDSILYLIEQVAKEQGIEIKTIEEAKEFLQQTQEGLKIQNRLLQVASKFGINDLQELTFKIEQFNSKEIKKLREKIEELENENELNEQYITELEGKLEHKEEQNKQLKAELAKVKDLKELNKRLREQLKQAHAGREQYAELEQFVKQLKEQIKAKNLTIEQLKEQFAQKEQELLEQIQQKDIKIEELEDKNNTLLTQSREKDRQIERLQEESKNLLQGNRQLKQQVQQLQLQPKLEPKVVVKEKIVYREDTEKVEKLKKELEEQKKKNKQKDTRIRELEEENESLRARLIEINRKLDIIERKLNMYMRKAKELEELVQKQEQEQKQEGQLDRLVNRLKELDEMLEDYKRPDWDKLDKEYFSLQKRLEEEYGIKVTIKRDTSSIKPKKEKTRDYSMDFGKDIGL